ncbi:MAG TPA: PQQ-dependent sugar dehydrogenase [Candidatus Limnocylindria bacterium]|nr:PQQ-dependent sugar dehydrogenase [Candidatus Limnocylindria bacterium]
MRALIARSPWPRALGVVAMVGLVVGCTPTSSAEPSAASPVVATPSPSSAPPDVSLELVADGLSTPVGLVPLPGADDRALVLEQTGRVWVLDGDQLLTDPFLDLTDRVVDLDPSYDERGLLGLAFHPDFVSNGRLFVYYSAPLVDSAASGQDHTNRLSELHVNPGELQADPATERVILEFEQPQPNHSGGALGFGPDGYLYLGAGDGGGTGDASEGHSPQGNAQDTAKLNGKILRLDVDGTDPYGIPPDNPLADGGGAPEIYAYGFRNPWRLSWEPDGERRLIVSDVGYGRHEEIDVVQRGGNYGWRIREGTDCLNVAEPLTPLASCQAAGENGDPLIDPVLEYTHTRVGVAVVGGFVYRGSAVPALAGRYVFADFSRQWTTDPPVGHGSVMAAVPAAGDAPWAWQELMLGAGVRPNFITGLGEDAAGELYLMVREELGPEGTTGRVLRIVPAD